MKIRYPNYYKKFQCIAGKCPDTCCAGWEISVDPNSEKWYRDAIKSGEISNRTFAGKLKKHIKHGRIISEGVTCPFLNEDRLCDMYIELGPDALCSTCRRHPRHMEDYGNLHEMLLLLSCPEAARLILEDNDGSFYLRTIPERQGNMDGIDEVRLEQLLEMRELIWKVCADTQTSLEHRMAFALALAHDMQRRLYKVKWNAENDTEAMVTTEPLDETDIADMMQRYSRAGAVERFVGQWKHRQAKMESSNTERRLSLLQDFVDEFGTLDVICRDWPEMLEICRTKICDAMDADNEYAAARIRYFAAGSDEDAALTNIFRYFIYSFMLSALYDDDVLTKVKMAICCTMLIAELDVQQFFAGEAVDRQTHCYALARQIENSDENRKMLEQFLKQETFAARRILNVLI